MNVFSDRQNTLVFEFELTSPRTPGFDLHEWLHDNMKLKPQDVLLIQVNVTNRHVYLKLRDETLLEQILQMTGGQLKYKHPNGEVSHVKIQKAGARTTRVRIANLAP
jgi:hypothetical protein